MTAVQEKTPGQGRHPDREDIRAGEDTGYLADTETGLPMPHREQRSVDEERRHASSG
ncbi:hypothetical protein K7G98_20930 [Saccharothrix sp. MB29]|nr:hypothetical protein [Saccharothrix sp. MB29]